MSNESVTLSIRLIRSCEHRNLRFFPLHQVDIKWTTEQLMEAAKAKIQTNSSLPPPFKKFDFNCMKVSCQKIDKKWFFNFLFCWHQVSLQIFFLTLILTCISHFRNAYVVYSIDESIPFSFCFHSFVFWKYFIHSSFLLYSRLSINLTELKPMTLW